MRTRAAIWLIAWSSMLAGLAAACTTETDGTITSSGSPTPSPTIDDGSYRLVDDRTADGVDALPSGDVADAAGSLRGTMTLSESSQVTWTIAFHGMTGRVKRAEIRYPASEGLSVIRLCAPCDSGIELVSTFPSRAVAEQFLIEALAGEASAILATARNPDGEVGGPMVAHLN
jgi:hypothetical protein